MTFIERLKARLDEEKLDGVSRANVASRLGMAPSSIDAWINRGANPRPKYFAALARFLRVPRAQMDEWFPDEGRREKLSRGRPLWGGERRSA